MMSMETATQIARDLATEVDVGCEIGAEGDVATSLVIPITEDIVQAKLIRLLGIANQNGVEMIVAAGGRFEHRSEIRFVKP